MDAWTRSTAIPVVTGRWHNVLIHLSTNSTAAESYIFVTTNATVVASKTFVRIPNHDIRYHHFGGLWNLESGDTAKIIYDLFSVNTNAP